MSSVATALYYTGCRQASKNGAGVGKCFESTCSLKRLDGRRRVSVAVCETNLMPSWESRAADQHGSLGTASSGRCRLGRQEQFDSVRSCRPIRTVAHRIGHMEYGRSFGLSGYNKKSKWRNDQNGWVWVSIGIVKGTFCIEICHCDEHCKHPMLLR